MRAARVRGRCDKPRCHEQATVRQSIDLGFAGGRMRVWVKRCEQHKVYQYEGYGEQEAA